MRKALAVAGAVAVLGALGGTLAYKLTRPRFVSFVNMPLLHLKVDVQTGSTYLNGKKQTCRRVYQLGSGRSGSGRPVEIKSESDGRKETVLVDDSSAPLYANHLMSESSGQYLVSICGTDGFAGVFKTPQGWKWLGFGLYIPNDACIVAGDAGCVYIPHAKPTRHLS